MYVTRDIEAKIASVLHRPEIIAVIGPRQCGKTTLVNKLLSDEQRKGKSVAKLSLDNVLLRRLLETNPEQFHEAYCKGQDIVFIDEIQYAKKAGQILKFLYDTYKTKFIVSGSSAIDIAVHSTKYLVGRILVFTLLPFSYREFVRANKNNLLFALDTQPAQPIQEQLNELLAQYERFGGYPAVVLAENEEEKKLLLQNIYNTYLLRDVKDVSRLLDEYKLVTLVRALATQTGNIINNAELCEISGFSRTELRRALATLEKTYIISLIKPFFRNKRTELIKNPKVYFFDLGFRNVANNQLQRERIDEGQLHENFVFCELTKTQLEIHFWRTKNGAEIDFIVGSGQSTIAIEVKTTASTTKAMHSFLEVYKPRKLLIATKNVSQSKHTGIVFIRLTHIAQHVSK